MAIQVSDQTDFLISYFLFFRGFMLKGNKQPDGLPKETSSHVRILLRAEEEQRTRQSERGSNSNMPPVIQARQDKFSIKPISRVQKSFQPSSGQDNFTKVGQKLPFAFLMGIVRKFGYSTSLDPSLCNSVFQNIFKKLKLVSFIDIFETDVKLNEYVN